MFFVEEKRDMIKAGWFVCSISERQILSSMLQPRFFREWLSGFDQEFSQYSWKKFRQDLLAGITIAAVALPLALAFGTASGTTAATGLITSVFASLTMGLLAGAPFQVSGPTAGMISVLSMIAMQHGIHGIWLAGAMAGILILIMSILKLGKLVYFIPASVITGFSSSVALVLLIGQADHFLGFSAPAVSSSWLKAVGYFTHPQPVSPCSVLVGLLVILIMFGWPRSWNERFPASLTGLIFATGLVQATQWPVALIGSIPRVFLLPERLNMSLIHQAPVADLIFPAISIALLCSMEALLCGAAMSNLSGIPFYANQELAAQGIGNLILPFFGGIPVTATMIRSSVMLKSGGQTRLSGVFKSFTLLLTMLFFAPIMSQIPLAALAGVILATAWRMNKWNSIRRYFLLRSFHEAAAFSVTILVTLMTDLVIGLAAGVLTACGIGLITKTGLRVDRIVQEDDPSSKITVKLSGDLADINLKQLKDVCTLSSVSQLKELDMSCLRTIDVSGLEFLNEINDKMTKQGKVLKIRGLLPDLQQTLIRPENGFHFRAEQFI